MLSVTVDAARRRLTVILVRGLCASTTSLFSATAERCMPESLAVVTTHRRGVIRPDGALIIPDIYFLRELVPVKSQDHRSAVFKFASSPNPKPPDIYYALILQLLLTFLVGRVEKVVTEITPLTTFKET